VNLKDARRELITRQRRVIGEIHDAQMPDEFGIYHVPLETVDKLWAQFDELAHMLLKIEAALQGDYD